MCLGPMHAHYHVDVSLDLLRLPCGHVFHHACLVGARGAGVDTCPLCRDPMPNLFGVRTLARPNPPLYTVGHKRSRVALSLRAAALQCGGVHPVGWSARPWAAERGFEPLYLVVVEGGNGAGCVVDMFTRLALLAPRGPHAPLELVCRPSHSPVHDHGHKCRIATAVGNDVPGLVFTRPHFELLLTWVMDVFHDLRQRVNAYNYHPQLTTLACDLFAEAAVYRVAEMQITMAYAMHTAFRLLYPGGKVSLSDFLEYAGKTPASATIAERVAAAVTSLEVKILLCP